MQFFLVLSLKMQILQVQTYHLWKIVFLHMLIVELLF